MLNPFVLLSRRRRRQLARKTGRRVWRSLPWPAQLIINLGAAAIGLLVIIGQVVAWVHHRANPKTEGKK